MTADVFALQRLPLQPHKGVRVPVRPRRQLRIPQRLPILQIRHRDLRTKKPPELGECVCEHRMLLSAGLKHALGGADATGAAVVSLDIMRRLSAQLYAARYIHMAPGPRHATDSKQQGMHIALLQQ